MDKKCAYFIILSTSYLGVFAKGPSINDVSSEREEGGTPSKPIYYISLYSNQSRQG